MKILSNDEVINGKETMTMVISIGITITIEVATIVTTKHFTLRYDLLAKLES